MLDEFQSNVELPKEEHRTSVTSLEKYWAYYSERLPPLKIYNFWKGSLSGTIEELFNFMKIHISLLRYSMFYI